MKTKRTNANKSVLICIVESPDSRDFFLASSTKARKENPVASLGCFSASDPSKRLSQHHSSFSSETESVQSDTTNEYKNLKTLEESQQNRKLWPSLVHMCERY